MTAPPPSDAYDGPASVRVHDDEIPVDVRLRGHFEPIDGWFHWYGRIATCPDLAAATRSGARVTLVTPHGTAEGRLSDVDPWGRYRVTGLGRPPF